jgi:hypothetical protein
LFLARSLSEAAGYIKGGKADPASGPTAEGRIIAKG